MRIGIVVDSACDLPREFLDQHGVLIMPMSSDGGGPITDARARDELSLLEDRVNENRLVVNEGHFFDSWGRRMTVVEAQPH